jgi:trehalose 6-phosphate phosphatase
VPLPDIDEFRLHAAEAGLFLDFDGTLSEIVATPEEARATSGASEVLSRLATRYRVVAVVSGRPARQVARLIDAPVRVFGLYGAETEEGAAAGWEALTAQVSAALPEIERAAAYVPGARVERKGLSAAVHYRGAADPEAARRVLLERLADPAVVHGLKVMEGKRVVELTAGPGPSKGRVVETAASDLRFVLFAGDDLADLDAFEALEQLAARGVKILKVAVRSEETPERLIGRADLVVQGPSGLLELLEGLAG